MTQTTPDPILALYLGIGGAAIIFAYFAGVALVTWASRDK